MYEETACEASGDFVVLRVCPISEYDFAIGQMRMMLTQTRDSVSGEVKLRGGTVSDVSGNISPQGTLTFTGAARDQSKFDIELQNVRFELPQREEMTGTFEEVYLSRIAILAAGGEWFEFARLLTKPTDEYFDRRCWCSALASRSWAYGAAERTLIELATKRLKRVN